jgi:hypothetical protein
MVVSESTVPTAFIHHALLARFNIQTIRPKPVALVVNPKGVCETSTGTPIDAGQAAACIQGVPGDTPTTKRIPPVANAAAAGSISASRPEAAARNTG